jgi:threonine dehydrogenase-like Zn-dependent dehydrogenase
VRHGERLRGAGGWRFGNTIDGAQAEYLLVPRRRRTWRRSREPHGRAGRALCRHRVDRLQRAESAASASATPSSCFAQGPIGLCATAGAKLMGAALVVGVDTRRDALAMAGGWAPTSYSTRARRTSSPR